jgi:pre-mRNA-splicing helicase BRR2
LATTQVWETVSRRWRQRKVLHQITLVIFDQMQLLTPEYEVVASRVRLMQSELKAAQPKGRPIRIVSLSVPIANGRDVALWLGVDVDQGAYFNFSPAVRP